MNELMSKLGLGSKTLVGMSLSSNNLLELVCLDREGKRITNYASVPVQYNSAIREIVNQEEFAEAVRTLFETLELNPKNCNVLLNLPNVHFAFEYLDSSITEDEIAEILQGKIEDLYIFKKNEAVVRYSVIGRNQENGSLIVAYSAIQTRMVEFLKDCFNDIGATLVSIDNSNSSLLKGIQYSECSRFDFNSTSILLITANSYSIFYLGNKRPLDYYEEPLAIKSFSNEEVYSAIANAASTTLAKFQSQELLVISETDEISAELLSSKIVFQGNIEYLDRNKWANGSFIDIDTEVSLLQNQIQYISIESVGAAATFYGNYVISFNFLSETVMQDFETINVMGKELTFPQYCLLVIGSAVVIALLLIVGTNLFCQSQISSYQSEAARLEASNNEMQTKIDQMNNSKTAKDIFTITKELQEVNQNDFMMLNAMSTDIPSAVWLDKFMLASGAFTTISGKSLSSNQIDEFFKNLQQRDPSLMLTKLERSTDGAIQGGKEIFIFEMTNDSLASSASDAGGAVDEAGAGSENMPNPDMGMAAPSDMGDMPMPEM